MDERQERAVEEIVEQAAHLAVSGLEHEGLDDPQSVFLVAMLVGNKILASLLDALVKQGVTRPQLEQLLDAWLALNGRQVEELRQALPHLSDQ